MTSPVQLPDSVRLDDLIDAITKVHSDVLDQLSDAVPGPPSTSTRSPTT